MAKKLTQAQERTLERIKRNSTPEAIKKSLDWYNEKLETAENDDWEQWYLDHIAMYESGWVLVQSLNSRTLEILAEQGYIEYKKQERWGGTPIDWAKLV